MLKVAMLATFLPPHIRITLSARQLQHNRRIFLCYIYVTPKYSLVCISAIFNVTARLQAKLHAGVSLSRQIRGCLKIIGIR